MSAETSLLHISRRAMATTFEVLLPRGAPKGAVEAGLQALEEVTALEAQLSIYRPDSELSRINREAGRQRVRVHRGVIELLLQAMRWYTETDGAFDVTAGPLVQAWGFTARRGRKPTDAQLERARELVGMDQVEIDAEAQTVFLCREGMQLNVGAIGKGYALDRVAQRLQHAEVADFLVHGGQSSVVAHGDAVPGTGTAWLVGLQHPTRSGQRLGGVRLRDQALATSGSGKQFFHFQGQRYGHVLDPRTGRPAGDLLSLTVLASTATAADALATGYFVLGRCETLRRAPAAPQRGFLCVDAGARPAEVRVEAVQLEADQWLPARGEIPRAS